MEQLQNLTRSQKTKYGKTPYEVALAVVLAFGSLRCLVTSLGLHYSFGNSFSGGPWSGFIACLNRIATYIGSKDYIILPLYKGGGEKYGLFLTCLLVILVGISYLVVKSRNSWLLLIYVVPTVVIAFAWKTGPSAVATAVLLAGLLMALTFFKMEEGFSWINIVTIGLAVALALGVANFGSVQHFFGAGPVVKVRAAQERAFDRARYGGSNIKDDERALTVTMEDPHEMWLRGYVGEEYGGKGWVPFSNSEQYAYLPVANAMKADKINALGQLQQSGSLLDKEDKTAKVEVDIDKANSKYVYIPYELADYGVEKSKNYGNTFLEGTGLRGNRHYSYKAGGNLTSKWTDLVGRYYTDSNPSEALKEYRTKEEYLNIDAYSRFRKLDDDTALVLFSAIGDPGDQSKGHIDYRTVIDKVRAFVADNLVYKKNPKYADHSIRGILEKKLAGDKDFASVATAMFRYYGVPARYVEGYQVTKYDVKDMAKNKAHAIKGKNFHAWTEIYMDGIGWIPLETVPEFMDRMTQPDMATGLQNEDLTNKFKPQFSEPSSKQSTVRTEQKVKERTWTFKKVVSILLLLILLIIAVALIIKKLVKVIKRRRAFNNPDKKLAVCAIYSAIVALGKRVPDRIRDIGEKAAYSNRESSEEERREMLNHWKECRRRRYS